MIVCGCYPVPGMEVLIEVGQGGTNKGMWMREMARAHTHRASRVVWTWLTRHLNIEPLKKIHQKMSRTTGNHYTVSPFFCGALGGVKCSAFLGLQWFGGVQRGPAWSAWFGYGQNFGFSIRLACGTGLE